VTEMALRMLATSLCVVGAYAWGLSTPAGDNDKITDLPGLTGESLTMFSGYLSSSDLKEKQIFYWLIEAADSPESAPLLWWSNGGPGCSGLLGLMSEHGPFRPTADSDLELNPYSWHFKANVLYVEQPAGVGFSYSDDPKDLKTGDAQAAIDNRLAIRAFLTKHPRFAKHPLFISSESYGGHYIPTLADEIVRDVVQPPLNFRGFLVGNPYVDPVENAIGLYGTWHGKQLVPSPLFWEWQAKCSNQSLAARAADKSLRMNCDAIETQPSVCVECREISPSVSRCVRRCALRTDEPSGCSCGRRHFKAGPLHFGPWTSPRRERDASLSSHGYNEPGAVRVPS